MAHSRFACCHEVAHSQIGCWQEVAIASCGLAMRLPQLELAVVIIIWAYPGVAAELRWPKLELAGAIIWAKPGMARHPSNYNHGRHE